MNKYRTK